MNLTWLKNKKEPKKRMSPHRDIMRKIFEQYMCSETWSIVRTVVMKRCKGRCWFCGCTPKIRIIHHKKYDNWGKGNYEEVFDCVLSCKECHTKEHRKMNPTLVPFFAKVFYEREFYSSVERFAA